MACKKEKYVDYIVEQTKKILNIDSPSGYTKEVADYVIKEYKKLGYNPISTIKGGILVEIGGKNSKDAVLLEAHIDTLGGIVTEIKSNGNLRISPIGGMYANNAEAENCRIITRFNGIYEGTLQLDNASIHVNGDYDKTTRKFPAMEVVIDENVHSKEDTVKSTAVTVTG